MDGDVMRSPSGNFNPYNSISKKMKLWLPISTEAPQACLGLWVQVSWIRLYFPLRCLSRFLLKCKSEINNQNKRFEKVLFSRLFFFLLRNFFLTGQSFLTFCEKISSLLAGFKLLLRQNWKIIFLFSYCKNANPKKLLVLKNCFFHGRISEVTKKLAKTTIFNVIIFYLHCPPLNRITSG